MGRRRGSRRLGGGRCLSPARLGSNTTPRGLPVRYVVDGPGAIQRSRKDQSADSGEW